ncbi:HIT domain-containing protein [Alloscardovia theropitheci]|uniref:HIT domain-containing protein n=1 Tax=Alloscardovia theropitheci TaxID=2496842 RepID=A0A4R0QR06_9BIFI|nr:HIT domain-containing protein [Alloscardovia theropitheci]TCD54773.1 HIT domain-containing protein [Alloscardovia theropitheci]
MSSNDSDGIRIDDPHNFPPQEDHYERLWTPQRMSYVLRDKSEEDRGNNNQNDSANTKSCPFCDALTKTDEDGLIVWRGKNVFIIMNLYPYNSGHVMVCPKEHVAMLTDLHDDVVILEFEKATQLAMTVMRNVSRPDGFNLGVNQGEAGGAGVATHLHQHIVPRWNGDSNFMPIVAQTRTMPILLENQRVAYAQEAARIANEFGL